MLYVYNYTLDHICLMLFFWSIMLTFSRSKDWPPMGLEACWTLPEQSSCWFCLEVYQPLNFCLPQNYVGILKLSETFWAQKKTLCSCAAGQVANAALDKYEKKKQELEKLEALLERLALRKKLTRMQRDHSWCQALLDFLASYAISY